MQPAPMTSGGLALEEITSKGWGPHLQYSFLIKLASLSQNRSPFASKSISIFKSRRNLHPRVKVDQAGRPLPPKKT